MADGGLSSSPAAGKEQGAEPPSLPNTPNPPYPSSWLHQELCKPPGKSCSSTCSAQGVWKDIPVLIHPCYPRHSSCASPCLSQRWQPKPWAGLRRGGLECCKASKSLSPCAACPGLCSLSLQGRSKSPAGQADPHPTSSTGKVLLSGRERTCWIVLSSPLLCPLCSYPVRLSLIQHDTRGRLTAPVTHS